MLVIHRLKTLRKSRGATQTSPRATGLSFSSYALVLTGAGYTPPQDALEKPQGYADSALRYRTLLFFLCAGSNRCWVYTASRRFGKAAGLRRLRPALQDSRCTRIVSKCGWLTPFRRMAFPGQNKNASRMLALRMRGARLPTTDDTKIVTMCQGKTAEGSVNSFV